MTQNIETRTEVAVKKYEGSAAKIEEIAQTDGEIETAAGKRKSFPKIAREWDAEARRLQNEWGNDSAVIREEWKNERNELSTKALGVKPWEAGQTESDINQQRRWTDNHTYLPITVPALMDASGPGDNWVPYTADKSATLNDVFGRKPVDLVAGITLVPDVKLQYPKLNAAGILWELNDSDVQLVVKSFSETADGYLVITLNDDSQVIAHKVDGATRSWVKGLSPSTFDTDWVFPTLQDMVGNAKLKLDETCRILGRKTANDGGSSLYRIVETGVPDGGNIIALDNGLFAERSFALFVRASEYGACDTDSSNEINAALTGNKRLQVDRLVSCRHVVPKSGAVIDVSEVLQLPDNSADAELLIDSDNADNVKITGSGRVSGNKTKQTGTKQQRLIRLVTNDSTLDSLEIGENYSVEVPGSAAHCVSMEGERNRLAALRLSSWSQEGLVLTNNKYSMVHDIIANDEDSQSWSAAQAHGSHNMMNGVIAKNTGASAVGCDSMHSVVSNIIADTIRWQNGLNMGHTGKPSDYSVASNVVVTNLNDPQNANAAGLSLSNGTRLVSVVNYSIKNPPEKKANKGLNVSAGGGEHQLLNAVMDGVDTAVNLWAAEYMALGNTILKNCDYGVIKNDDAILQMMNVDFSGAKTPMSGAGDSTNVRAVNALFSRTDLFHGGVVLSNVALPHRINTKNMREFSTVVLEPSNANGARAMPFISRRGNGYFEIDVAGYVDGGSHLRWRIV